jgi:hypothetical protein
MAAVVSGSESGAAVGVRLGKMVAGKMGGRVAVTDDVVGCSETAVVPGPVLGGWLAVPGQIQLINMMDSTVISRGIKEYQNCLLCHRLCGG